MADTSSANGALTQSNGIPHNKPKYTVATKENVASLLANDRKVKVAGVDPDGVLRGKIMAKDKFLASVDRGFAMSSAVFGWDMHDELYSSETMVASASEGYCDFMATPDLASFRRLPFEDNIPFFLVHFASNDKPVSACGRSIIRSLCDTLAAEGVKAMAGVELEFVNFQTPTEDGYGQVGSAPNLAAFLSKNTPKAVRPLTSGMFGYSTTRPIANKDYFHQIFDTSDDMNCQIESWHTESGPGVFEAALLVSEVDEMADKVSLFKLLSKAIGIEHNITPCFMAKPLYGVPGNSGHIHISLTDLEGNNLFARPTPDPNPQWPDIASLSDLGRHFLAGVLDALPDIMPMLAPTVNSYKRLIENYWAPVDVSWGLEHRLASIRLITPPICKPGATRIEVRLPGADLHPHYALATIVAAGWRGVRREMEIAVPPAGSRPAGEKAALLPRTLDEALARFRSGGSVAREILDGEFVDFFAATRDHELKLWREAVTDWEFCRYVETV